MEAKEEIRNRLNIEDVVGEYVQLKRAGRNWKGLSPFSNEKTPSFIVSPDKQIWHDFSSNKGGDVFSFVMEVEGLDFRAAMEMLARKAGVDLSLFQNASDKGHAQKKARLYEALELSAKFYQRSLIANPKAVEYVFKKRRLSREVVQAFQIGYSPNSEDALYRALIKKGFNPKELRDTGLIVQRRGRDGDMFRGRMMVSLCDSQGRVVGFTARLIEDVPGAPKYINTPQTLLYDKGRQVFGLHLAKESIRKEDVAVIVEGNLDVISSHQAGVKNVVATAGTAMTLDHLKQLGRLTNNICLAFDSDAAGLAATERAIAIAQVAGVRLSIITMPEGAKDPDELIQQDPKLWEKVIKESTYVIDWVMDQYAARYDPKSAEGKRLLSTKTLEVIRALKDPIEKEHYVKLLAKRTESSVEATQAKLEGLKQTNPNLQYLKTMHVKPSEKLMYYPRQDLFLGLNALHPELRDTLRDLQVDDFEGELRQQIFEHIKSLESYQIAAGEGDALPRGDIYDKIQQLKLAAEEEEMMRKWGSSTLYGVASDLAHKILKKERTKKRTDILQEELRQAEARGDETARRDLLKQITTIIKEQKNSA